MTPEEKAAQITTAFALPQMQESIDRGAATGSGSFLFVTDPKETNRLQRLAREKSRLKIPILFGFDVIHGLATIFPVPIGMAASWDPAFAERAQAIAGAEARAVGIHWAFAPMIDIARDPRWGRIVEGAGEDPYLGSVMAAAQVRGFQGPRIGTPGRIIAGPKHFAAYGAALGGRDYDEVNASDNELWNVHLPTFQAAIDAGAGNIMTAYMGVNGIPATGNRWLLRDVLRDRLGFKGWVVSDADAVKNLATHGLAVDAQDARIAAERSAVLLKNEGGLLPLDRAKLRSVAVIGSLADSPVDSNGPWVFPQNNPASQSLLDGIRSKLGSSVRVTYAAGVTLPQRLNPSPFAAMSGKVKRPEPSDDRTGILEAVQAAAQSDVAIIVVGETAEMIGESASRSSLDLPGRQQELLDAVVATGKPVVVVLLNGRPLDLKETRAPAILDLWFPGSRGGDAAANLLFGDAVPGGKLPFTWPRNVGQVPLVYSRLISHDPKNADKRYWNELNSPVHPFGFGLSYTTFAYSNLRVDKAQIAPGASLTVSVDLRNTGSRTADEVAQLYLHQKSGSAARPVRALKGFRRVTPKPGEMRTLSFRLGPDELRYWNAASRDWVIDEAPFVVAVGGDSTVPFGAEFVIKKP